MPSVEDALLVYALTTWALLILVLLVLVALVGRSRRTEARIHQLHSDLTAAPEEQPTLFDEEVNRTLRIVRE